MTYWLPVAVTIVSFSMAALSGSVPVAAGASIVSLIAIGLWAWRQ